jgi:propionyl-CoA carboxylase alpha chain
MLFIQVWVLSENADFAEKQNKTTSFFGPKSKAIYKGNKLAAKEAVKAYNIPWFPQTKPLPILKKAKVVAREIGFPILIKASAGGGGKECV